MCPDQCDLVWLLFTGCYLSLETLMWPDTSALLHCVYATSYHVDLKSFVLLIVI